MVDDTCVSKAMKFIVPHPMTMMMMTTTAIDDGDHHPPVVVTSASLIYEGDYHNAQQLLTALK